MIKVLFVITKDDVGGAQKYVRDLAENLNPEKFEVKILTGGRGRKSDIRFLSNTFRPYFLFLNDLAAVIELLFIFLREKPDIIHLNSSKAGVIGTLAAEFYRLLNVRRQASGVKVVFTAHGWVFNPDNDLSWLRRKFYILLHKLAAYFQDKIINVSEYDRQLALKYKIAPLEKLITVYNGIEEISFLNKKEARRLINKIIGGEINPEAVWIGSVGRLVIEKDYRSFIEAATLVKNTYFFIIGSGPEYKKLRVKVKRLNLNDKFFILENIAPASPFLRAFDLFVLSSIKEGLPYTLLEAMAAKLPIVVTRVGGMTEIVNSRGLVMPPRQPEELARAINHFLENPEKAQEAAIEANKFLKEKLTLERMIRETENVYIT